MRINITRQITGVNEETYVGEFKLMAKVTCKFETEDGRDLWKVSPETAKSLVESTKLRIQETIKKKLTKMVIEELQKELEKQKLSYVITPYVKKRLLLVNPVEVRKLAEKRGEVVEI